MAGGVSSFFVVVAVDRTGVVALSYYYRAKIIHLSTPCIMIDDHLFAPRWHVTIP
jgi:hypothetical protein